MIEASHLSKKYNKTQAVNDLSFTVETGKVTGFLGPNGAGKSTTMRLMLGLENGSGRTTFDNKRLGQYRQPSQIVGIMLEAKAYHPSRSARQHLNILAEAGGVPLTRTAEVLDEVGLSNVAKKAPGKFSLGMSQRLGIAAAMLGRPKYLVLDEPANGLDPEGIAWLRDFLKDYASQGNAVLVSSHLLSEMALLADNVIVIGRGKVLANTGMTELLNKNADSGVFVRTDDDVALAKVLRSGKHEFAQESDGLLVSGDATTDQIGTLAAKHGLTILELTKKQASLEEVFLQITAGSEDYVAKKGKS